MTLEEEILSHIKDMEQLQEQVHKKRAQGDEQFKQRQVEIKR